VTAAGGRHVHERRVAQRQPEGGRDLARDAAHRQRVAAVGRDRDVEHLVAQLQQLDDIGAERRVLLEHEDAGRLGGQAQLGLRADHPVGRAAVGLPRGDREATRQLRAGQRERHAVARGEVRRAAHDLALTAARVDVAEADGLREAGQLLDVEHLGDDDAGDVVADPVHLLDLEPGAHERGGDVVGVGAEVRHQRAEPGQGDAHGQASRPKGSVKRWSPS